MGTRLVTASTAVGIIHEGSTVGIGGSMNMAPMCLIKEIIRQNKRDLHLICAPAGAINVDILIGAGLVSSIRFGQVALDEFGTAPNFRRNSEAGALVCRDTP